MDADCLPSLPLSLQDMCMLCIMLRLEEFPTDSLTFLPSAIRRRLFLGLSHADLLHVDTEVLFGDLNYLGYDPSREDHRQRGPAVAREELLDVFFQGPNSTFFCLNLEAALDCYQSVKSTCDDGEFDLIEHICKCYLSLEPTMVPLSYKDVVVLPKRFLQFVSLYWKQNHYSQSQTCKLQVPLEMAQPLLTYCKMQYAPQNLKIDCFSFRKTLLFEEDYACWEKIKERYALLEKKKPHITLQDFLSSVEILELTDNTDVSDVDYSSIVRIPYVILYNIVTSSQPRLKYLKIHGIPFLSNRGLGLTFKLFLKTNSSSLPDPYPLEGLSVLVPHWHRRYPSNSDGYISSYNLASNLQSLVAFHMHTLKHVTIRGIRFCYTNNSIMVQDCDEYVVEIVDVPAYATLLSSSFTQLLKQPQFHTLSVGESPLSGACALIKTFLTTPASHEQTLCVEGLDEHDLMMREDERNYSTSEEEEITSDSDEDTFVVKRPRFTKQRKKLHGRFVSLSCSRWSHKIPDTNAQIKCLDLGHSSSCIHSLLFSLPELKLKKLRMRTQDMTLVPAGTAIKVEHVVFSTQTDTSYKPTISPAHLEKFTISNLILKRLKLEHPTDECAPGLIPALIHCLSKLYQQGRGLDELVLDSITFDDIDLKELFLTVRHLSHQHGTTLVLTLDFSRYHLCQQSSLFVDLGKDFQEKKIKKIVCNMKDCFSDPRPQLSPLAEEVVVNYRKRCFYTKSNRKCYF